MQVSTVPGACRWLINAAVITVVASYFHIFFFPFPNLRTSKQSLLTRTTSTDVQRAGESLGAVPSNTVAKGHMWLFKFKFIKIKKLVFQSY